jgi:hypothetical protein
VPVPVQELLPVPVPELLRVLVRQPVPLPAQLQELVLGRPVLQRH